MHCRQSVDARQHRPERLRDVLVPRLAYLQAQQRRDHAEVVLHSMVEFVQEQGLRVERLRQIVGARGDCRSISAFCSAILF